MTEFSIDYILNRAGDKYLGTNASLSIIQRIKLQVQQPLNLLRNGAGNLDWLQQSPHSQSQQSQQLQQLQQHLCHSPAFDWLQYTRYHPPKLPRPFRQGPVKRTPGRLPRIPFTPAQLENLEKAYQNSNYLSATDANQLAESLELTNTRVKIWFQNRRARERREKRERDDIFNTTCSSNGSSPEPDMVAIV